MHRTLPVLVSLVLTAAPWAAAPAWGIKAYPARPVCMLVPFAAGSQTDILARWIGEKIAEKSGQQVVVDNRPSAGGTIASQYMLAANPDGHTLMMVSTGHAGNATLYSKVPYDTVKDFAGVTRVASVPNRERMLTQGATPAPTSPEEFDAFIRSEVKRFAKVLIAAGARIN